jgi:hypothetical protein
VESVGNERNAGGLFDRPLDIGPNGRPFKLIPQYTSANDKKRTRLSARLAGISFGLHPSKARFVKVNG